MLDEHCGIPPLGSFRVPLLNERSSESFVKKYIREKVKFKANKSSFAAAGAAGLARQPHR
jgi:hypothetical protein